jgi:hypothetical protein
MDPRLQGLAAQLELHSKLLLNCLDGISDDDAAVRAGGTTNSIAFLLHHEAYHIGQLALLRRYTGSPAMSYR